MKLTLYVLALFTVFCTPRTSLAQGQHNQWCFGQSFGLNFNTTPPSFFQTNMNVIEGCASVCDNAGNMLFYSSGAYVWDRNGNYMPNGQGLNGNGPAPGMAWPQNMGSSANGVVIVPSAADTNKYYLVTTDAEENHTYNAYYSVIDMSLNGGLGDVVPTQKNILLSTGISEGVIATTAAGCSGYWVVVHSRYGNDYRAFRIDNNGMSATPVVSGGMPGNPAQLTFGYMKFNNAGTKMVRSSPIIEMADFNKATGVLSGFFYLLQPVNTPGQMVFSPDDTKLYRAGTDGVTQFNLSLLPNVAAVQSTQVKMADTLVLSGIRLGPDQKIYLSSRFLDYIHIIHNPNASGAACQFEYHAMTLPPYASTTIFKAYELGNGIPLNVPTDTIYHTAIDTVVCFEPGITLKAPGNYPFYFWSTHAATPQITVNQDGAYWVHGHDNCMLATDTFKVHFVRFDSGLGNDTTICDGDQIILDVTQPAAVYQWQDNSSLPTYMVSGSGLYKVKISVEGCILDDSVVVAVMNPFVNIKEQDTTVCKEEPFSLHGIAFPESHYSWNTGAIAPALPVTRAGNYILTASNVCGDFVDSVNIEMIDCLCEAFMPNAFSPNNDGINDILKAELDCPRMTDFRLKIFNRFGQCVFEGSEPGQGWNGYHNNSRADMGTYFYYIQYKNATGTVIAKKGDVVLIR